jgi:hypothetical protein
VASAMLQPVGATVPSTEVKTTSAVRQLGTFPAVGVVEENKVLLGSVGCTERILGLACWR